MSEDVKKYVRFERGSQAAYQRLAEANRLNNDTLYFIYTTDEDDKRHYELYLGTNLISSGVDGDPDTAEMPDINDLQGINVSDLSSNDILVFDADSGDDGEWVNISLEELSDRLKLPGILGNKTAEPAFVPVPSAPSDKLFLRSDGEWDLTPVDLNNYFIDLNDSANPDDLEDTDTVVFKAEIGELTSILTQKVAEKVGEDVLEDFTAVKGKVLTLENEVAEIKKAGVGTLPENFLNDYEDFKDQTLDGLTAVESRLNEKLSQIKDDGATLAAQVEINRTSIASLDEIIKALKPGDTDFEGLKHLATKDELEELREMFKWTELSDLLN